jgi:hypothetical protein
LEGGDVGLKFQLKMLEFMDSVNQELKRGKDKGVRQEKMIEFLMMQGVRPSSLTKKLAKVNMPITFSGLGKAKKIKDFYWKWKTTTMSKGPKRTIRSP